MARWRWTIFAGILIAGAGIWSTGITHTPAPERQPRALAKPPVAVTTDFAVPVLMYHRVCDLTEREARSPLLRDLTVSPADFEAQLRYLTDQGFTIISVAEVATALYDDRPLPVKAVAITLDDGYRDNFTQAYPILQRYQAPATVFLVTSVVGDNAHVTWEQVARMQASVSFQSHTVHHYDLTTLAPDLLQQELTDAKTLITQHTRQPVEHLAYPSGAYNRNVVTATGAAGYRIGWKKGGGPVTPDADPLLLPRIRVHGRTTLRDFERKVWSGVYQQSRGDRS